ncbi:MAG TPA: DNA topoisomerase I [Solirubrobacterales bacterium]|jgi:DNA topoisomerase-1|nr:DNA topoisomerase I [Solirubrobacterales bacterium]
MRLIVTEKNNSAKKIAEILSGGTASEGSSYKTPFYTWTDDSGEQMTIGLKGHVLNPAFPESYNNWQETNPRDLIDADLIKEPTDKNVVRALKKVAKDADDLVIATDFDREGELIGLEALQEIVESNPDLAVSNNGDFADVKRARYSALTKDEIERAFGTLDELSMPLANAGAARQDIDLIWGATLTRAVSTATRRFGSNFLSVGRVQSPTLGLIVQRELERRAHEPEPFWEVTAKFAHPDGEFVAEHTTDRFWKKQDAEAAVANSKTPGTVKEISAKKNTRKPPTPLNTTAFTTDVSSRLGITPSRAMRIAEDLYMDGYISYPRTDNTVYPKSLDTKELVKQLVAVDDFKAASFLLDKPSLDPTRGKKETTDHPPIYPTQAVNPQRLEARSEAHRRVYELVARRFLATFSPPMVSESTRANIETAKGTASAESGETYFVRGSVVLDPGFAAIYTYARSADTEIPKLEEGQQLDLEDVEMEGKETPPPPRISQGKLIELMEERGLGTKATRADIIQKLYDRGYVFGNPPEPSETGIAMSKAFEHYVPRMATPDMTAEMEAEMDQIAAGEMTKDQVLRDSRDMLRSAFDEMGDDVKTEDEEAKWRKFAREVWAGMDQDRILGPCIVCQEAGRKQEDGSPNMLRIIKARKSGKRFVGCQGWDGDNPDSPDSCDQTFPLPQRVRGLYKIEEVCSVCGRTPRLQVIPWRGRPWKLCLNDECPSMAEMKRRRAERERAKAEKEAAEAAAKDGGDGEDAVKEAEKIAGQASATKVKRARNGSGSRTRGNGSRSKSGTRSKPRANS